MTYLKGCQRTTLELLLLSLFCSCTAAFAENDAKTAKAETGINLAQSSDTNKNSIYEQALIELRCDEAIRLLTAPLNKAIAAHDYELAGRIMRMIALAFRLDDNDQAAAQAALLASRLDPGDESCRFQAAEYLFRAGKWQDAEKIFESLCNSKSKNTRMRAIAFLDQHRGKILQAKEELEEYLKANPNDQRALLRLCMLYLVNEENGKAAMLEQKLADLSPSEYLKEIFLGRAEESKSHLNAAEEHFNAAGKFQPDDPLWHCQLGMMLMKHQRIKEADLEYRKCFKCKRLHSQAFTNWAVLEAFFGDIKNADRCLSYLAQLRPNSSDLHFLRGIVDEKKARLEKAEEDFYRTISLNPHSSGPYIHLLGLPAIKSDLTKRCELCREWTTACPQSAVAAIELANTFKAQGKEEEALQRYLHAEALMKGRDLPKDNNYVIELCSMHANIAAIFYKRKNSAAAIEEAEEFNNLRPILPNSAGLALRPPKIDLSKLKDQTKKAAEHALLADSLYEAQQLSDAEHEYRSALVDDPDNINYHSALLKVLMDKKDLAGAAQEDIAVSNHVVTHLPDLFDSGKSKSDHH